MTLVRVPLPADQIARLDRLRGTVPVVTRRTALVAQLVRLGLDVAEQEPARLVAAPKEMA
jgi:hypothetical protein